MQIGQSEFFDYRPKENAGIIDFWVNDVGAHCWGEIRFKPTDQPIGDIDFWENGEDDYWYPDGSHPWRETKTTLFGEMINFYFEGVENGTIDIPRGPKF